VGCSTCMGVNRLNWCEISVKTDKVAADAVSGILIQCGAGGVEIEDPDLVKQMIMDNVWDAYAFTEEFLKRDFMVVKAYLPCDKYLDERVRDFHELLHNLDEVIQPGSIKEVSFANVREEDWANSWKAYYKPVRISEHIVIKPTWEDYDSSPGELVVELDPGMAFGTGTHPTTVMCVRLLEKLIKGGETVFDIGTGSGILAITAAKLGARVVKAVDIDEIAIKAAVENVVVNGVADVVEVMPGNLLDRVQGQADIVVSNIVADVIINVTPDAVKAVRKGGQFVASGIIDTRKDDVLAVMQKNGLVIKEVCQERDWVSLIAAREE